MGKTKQISLAFPEVLYKESKEHSEEYGYKNLQEFILDILRRKVVIENVERHKEIELEMRKYGKKMSQKQAVKHLNEF